MSVVFDQTTGKAVKFAAGLRKHLSEVSKYGVNDETLKKMEADAAKAQELVAEVERLREQASETLKKANASLDAMKHSYMSLRQVIKNNYDQPQWEKFGLMDKR